MSLIRPDREGSRRALPTHAQALETYWRQLELTPHRKITLGVTTLQCRADMLKWAFALTNGVLSGGNLVAMNWVELGVVPVNNQGLTEGERKLCAWAGQAMARLFAEEGLNHGLSE